MKNIITIDERHKSTDKTHYPTLLPTNTKMTKNQKILQKKHQVLKKTFLINQKNCRKRQLLVFN
jgi:hypothetical protein